MSSLRCTRSPDAHHHLCTWLTQNTNLGGQPWQNLKIKKAHWCLSSILSNLANSKTMWYKSSKVNFQLSTPQCWPPDVTANKNFAWRLASTALGEKWVQHANWWLAENIELHFWTKTTRIHQSVVIIQFQQNRPKYPHPRAVNKETLPRLRSHPWC